MNKKKLIKNKYKPIFKKKDYNSEMGMSTHIWGPSIHHALHTISFNYPIKYFVSTVSVFLELAQPISFKTY